MYDSVKLSQRPVITRLAIVLPSLAGGGMERVQLNLIQEWVRQGIDIDLVVSRLQGPLCNLIPPEAKVFEIAGRHSYLFPFGLYRYLKARKPTHILTSANDLNVITLFITHLLRLHAPVVISVHNHLSSELQLAKGLQWIKLHTVVWLLKRTIHRCHAVIAVSQGVADDLTQHLLLQVAQLHVVYNPVITSQTHKQMTDPLIHCPVPQGTPWILYVGRFVQAKGVDVLLNAFECIAHSTKAHLVLMGTGPLLPHIVERIAKTGLNSRIHLVGFQDNPLPWMREADIVVLPSRHEGLGNVLIEAMACGTQVVATDSPSGPSEILDGGRFGQLVPVDNYEELAIALLKSLNEEFRVDSDLLRKRAELFTACRAAKKYYNLLMAGK